MADNKSNGLAKADELANGLTSDLANDNEIIRGLERMSEEDPDGFSSDLLDLINRQKTEIERLKEYEDIRPTGCPNCHKGNFSNSKFCCHCGKQLQEKKKDVKSEAIREEAERVLRESEVKKNG